MEFIKLKLFYNKFLGGRMNFNDDTEIINPVLKIIREYEMYEKAELARYNLEKKEKKKQKRKFKNSKHYKLLKNAAIYIGIFMMISAFKMKQYMPLWILICS